MVFWLLYYLLFSVIWAQDGNYLASFYLEFILLPTRMLVVYVTLYFLLPKYLVQKKYLTFVIGYLLILTAGAIMQRIFIHLFYENLLLAGDGKELFSLQMLLRAIILINSTALFVLGIKIFQLYVVASEKLQSSEEVGLEIRSNRRTHKVKSDQILFVEGLGNYVNYHLVDGSKIISYGSMKNTLNNLPDHFVRVHKSYVVNKHHISSFDASNVQLKNQEIPRGKNISDEVLLN